MGSQNPQAMVIAPFFYYNPDPQMDQRQHGHFSTDPKQHSGHAQGHQGQQQWINHHMMMYGQPPMMYPHLPSSNSPHKPVMATPRPVQQRPAFLNQYEGQQLVLDTQCNTTDLNFYPVTPSLSMSGSAASSPPSTCAMLATPVTGSSLAFDVMEGVKDGCEGDVKSEILAGGDWTRCGSPLLTPGKSHITTSILQSIAVIDPSLRPPGTLIHYQELQNIICSVLISCSIHQPAFRIC